MDKRNLDDNCINDLRRSLEITVSFLIAILIVILIPLIATVPTAAVTNNALPPANALVAQSQQAMHFRITLYNSTSFILLVVFIVCTWLFIALSYLTSDARRKLWTLCMSGIFLVLVMIFLSLLSLAHSNYLHLMTQSVIIGSIAIAVFIYIAVFFWRIAKHNACH